MRSALLIALCAVSGACAAAAPSHAADGPSEYEVKAALLFNFAKFVTWPAGSFASPDAPFTVGIVGDDPFGKALERTLAGKTVGGRQIAIRRWRKVHDRAPCQILFVATSDRDERKQVLDDVQALPVLTVGDTNDFARQGGIIGLTVEDNRIRFEINPAGADHAHLAISSRLLSLARVVSPHR